MPREKINDSISETPAMTRAAIWRSTIAWFRPFGAGCRQDQKQTYDVLQKPDILRYDGRRECRQHVDQKREGRGMRSAVTTTVTERVAVRIAKGIHASVIRRSPMFTRA
jgi:hypothetical protein